MVHYQRQLAADYMSRELESGATKIGPSQDAGNTIEYLVNTLANKTSAVPKRGRSKCGRTQEHANECKRAKMSAKERKRKSAKERKRAQKGAKERKRVLRTATSEKIACKQVPNNQVWELPNLSRILGTL